jgi:hypothetical protein
MADEKLSVSPAKELVKTVHLYAGLDLIGSKTTLSHKDAELELIYATGLRVTSRKTKRVVLLPFSNIKGIELFSDQPNKLNKLK